MEINTEDYVDIENCASELELLDSSEFSLIKLLDYCKTKYGKALLRDWVSKPLKNAERINHRLDMVGYFGEEEEIRRSLFAKLKQIPDMATVIKLFSEFEQGKGGAKLEHCVKVYHYAQVIQEILAVLEDKQYFYQDLVVHKENSERVVGLVNKTINLDCKSLESEYRINPSFSSDLAEINEKIKKIDTDIEELRTSASFELGLKKELQAVKSETYGILFEGSKAEIHAGLRECNNSSYTIVSHLQSKVKITSTKLKKKVAAKNALNESYLNAQIDLEYKIIEMVAEFIPFIKQTIEIISNLDAILSLAHASFTSVNSYCRPFINNVGIIDIKSCRHPCLEQIGNCVPNDVKMKKYTGNIILITGPNMGGKSTYLRQVALCVLLAHIGCFVPASSASICIVDSVMAMIGASDNQLSGISTFMSEMQKLALIEKKSTSDSLLIIDEIGRGTSSSEGCGIAWGMLNYLAQLGCFALIATHFSELESLKLPNISHFYTDIDIDSQNINMKYQVMPGYMKFSYGIQIAKMAGIPEAIINCAYQIKEQKTISNFLKSKDRESIYNFYGLLKN